MASLAGTTLVWPGSALDRIWNLNPRAHEELAPFGRVVGIPFLLLGATLAVASLGWFKRRRWGWRLAVAIIATQVLGNLVNIYRGDLLRGRHRLSDRRSLAVLSPATAVAVRFRTW